MMKWSRAALFWEVVGGAMMRGAARMTRADIEKSLQGRWNSKAIE